MLMFSFGLKTSFFDPAIKEEITEINYLGRIESESNMFFIFIFIVFIIEKTKKTAQA